MIWIFLCGLGGMAAIAVAAWARASLRRVDAEESARRAQKLLDLEEQRLLEKLRDPPPGTS